MIKIPKPKVRNLLDLDTIYDTMKTSYDLYRDEEDNWFSLDSNTRCYKTRRLFTIIRKKPDIYVTVSLSKLYDGYHFEIWGGSDIGNSRFLWRWDSPYDPDNPPDKPEADMDMDDFKADIRRHDDIYEEFIGIIDIIKLQGGIV